MFADRDIAMQSSSLPAKLAAACEVLGGVAEAHIAYKALSGLQTPWQACRAGCLQKHSAFRLLRLL